ncbi:hypothetical protein DFH06DRAFT_1477049 [Mycena polygramma]|nr:hypothetical protein DFH06DRAFT_1477049 [Mycena polygramma]
MSLSDPRPLSFWGSPFCEQFYTNYVPSDGEIEQIRAHHDTIQRNHINDYIEPHNALISVPRRLPQDLVEQIFLGCLPIHHNAVMSVTEAPLLLGRICSAWRSIAFGMPRLWASLHISAHFIAGSEERRAALVHWLKRSGQLPLSISVSYSGAPYDGGALVEQILPFSARWHALRISAMPRKDFFQLVGASTPLLADVNITLTVDFGPRDGSRVLSSNLFGGMNSRRVSITTPDLSDLVPSTPFRWDHLTHLALRSNHLAWSGRRLGCETAYRLLEGCPYLISLELRIDLFGPGGPYTEHLESSLESLIIDVDGPFHFAVLENFIDRLFMPRLGRFHLVQGTSSMTVPSICGVFLEHLGQRSPLISDLRLNLLDFTPDASAASRLPLLHELITESDWFEDDILVDFLQAHLDHGTNLRRFQLNFRCERPEIIPDIRRFLDHGLEVSLQYVR